LVDSCPLNALPNAFTLNPDTSRESFSDFVFFVLGVYPEQSRRVVNIRLAPPKNDEREGTLPLSLTNTIRSVESTGSG